MNDVAKIGGFALSLITAAVATGVFVGGQGGAVKANTTAIQLNTAALKDLKAEGKEDRKSLVKLVVLMSGVDAKVTTLNSQYKESLDRMNRLLEKSLDRANQK